MARRPRLPRLTTNAPVCRCEAGSRPHPELQRREKGGERWTPYVAVGFWPTFMRSSGRTDAATPPTSGSYAPRPSGSFAVIDAAGKVVSGTVGGDAFFRNIDDMDACLRDLKRRLRKPRKRRGGEMMVANWRSHDDDDGDPLDGPLLPHQPMMRCPWCDDQTSWGDLLYCSRCAPDGLYPIPPVHENQVHAVIARFERAIAQAETPVEVASIRDDALCAWAYAGLGGQKNASIPLQHLVIDAEHKLVTIVPPRATHPFRKATLSHMRRIYELLDDVTLVALKGLSINRGEPLYRRAIARATLFIKRERKYMARMMGEDDYATNATPAPHRERLPGQLAGDRAGRQGTLRLAV